MELKLKAMQCLCELEEFTINGINAYYDDFGSKGDSSPETAEEYACGDMQFAPKLATQAVLEKYRITVDEYNEVAGKLEEALSFRSCGWCV